MSIMKTIARTKNARSIGDKDKGTYQRVCDVYLMNPTTCKYDVKTVETKVARAMVLKHRQNWEFVVSDNKKSA